MSNAIVLYHANCTDGFAAAWAFSKTAASLFSSVEYISVSYGKRLTEVPVLEAGTSVFILDFSFNKEDLQILCAQAKKVTLIDHHISAYKDLQSWIAEPITEDRPDNLITYFDMDRSGAGLTWEYFAPERSRPEIINYVEDRDLWRFTLRASVEMNAPILLIPFGDFKAFDDMAVRVQTDPDGVIAAGKLLVQQKDQYVKQLIKLARPCLFQAISGEWLSGLCANCNYQFASDVGNELAKLSGTFGGTYFTDAQGNTQWSLRSIGDYDVSQIAKMFGGGEHKNAAGFKLYATDEVKNEGVKVWLIKES